MSNAIFKSERGDATLVGVVMAAAIGAVIMLTNAQMFSLMSRENRNVLATQSAVDIQREVEMFLSTENNCNANFDGDMADGTWQTTALVDELGGNVFVPGTSTYMNNTLRIVNWRITDTAVIMRAAAPAEMLVHLDLRLQKVGDVAGPQEVFRTIKLVTRKIGLANTAIDNCYALVGAGSDLWVRDASGANISNTNTGNVGVGTTTPGQLLSVGGPGPGNFQVGTDGDVTVSGGADSRWALYSSSGTERMVIQPGGAVYFPGNVGIGTANPTTALEVTGNSTVNGNEQINGNETITGNLTVGGNTNITGALTAGSISTTGAMSAGSITSSGPISATQFCIAGNCRTTFAAQTCPAGQVIRQIDPAGTVVCSNPNCPVNTYYRGMDAAGAPICAALPTATCPVNQYISSVNPMTGAVTCANIPPGVVVPSCPAGQYMTQITNGVATCSAPAAAIAGGTCAVGSVVTAISTTGVPTCTPQPTNSQTCAAGTVVTGFTATGVPICGAPPAGAGQLDFSYMLANGVSWNFVSLGNSGGGLIGGDYSCGVRTAVTLVAPVTATTRAALVGFYHEHNNEASSGLKIYSGSGTFVGYAGQTGRGGDGRSYGSGAEVIVPLSSGQMQLQSCHRDGGTTSWRYTIKAVIN